MSTRVAPVVSDAQDTTDGASGPAGQPPGPSQHASRDARTLLGWSRSVNLANLCRPLGGAALAAGLAQFLLLRVEVQNDLQRFGLLLLQTGAFAGAAIVLQRLSIPEAPA